MDWTSNGRAVYTASSGTEENLGSLDPDGGSRRQLTALSGEGEWTMNPSTCGDGRHIVAESNRKGTFGGPHRDPDRSAYQNVMDANMRKYRKRAAEERKRRAPHRCPNPTSAVPGPIPISEMRHPAELQD